MTSEKPICIKEVNENIIRVREGLPLTKSLKVLNQFCEFRKELDNRFNLTHEEELKEEVKKRKREYYQKHKDEINARRRIRYAEKWIKK